MGKQFCLSSIKNLAGQTLWYGLPSITSRFLGYLMNLSLPLFFSEPAVTADLTLVYAAYTTLLIHTLDQPGKLGPLGSFGKCSCID